MEKKKLNHLWVVEYRKNDGENEGEWEPTTLVGTTRDEAREKKSRWEQFSGLNKGEQLRVVKYVDGIGVSPWL